MKVVLSNQVQVYFHEECNQESFVILSGPSGGGKTFLSNALVSSNVFNCVLLVKHTDREIRNGEIDGIDYFFRSKADFTKEINEKSAVVYAQRYGHQYGLTLAEVTRAKKCNQIPIFILDVDAAIDFKKVYPNSTIVFVAPKQVDIVKERIINRPEKQIEKELRIAFLEDEYSKSENFDLFFDNVESTDSFINRLVRRIQI